MTDKIMGYDWADIQSMQRREFKGTPIKNAEQGVDTGADPLGDGTFRMYPSGDIVDFDERCRRLPLKR